MSVWAVGVRLSALGAYLLGNRSCPAGRALRQRCASDTQHCIRRTERAVSAPVIRGYWEEQGTMVTLSGRSGARTWLTVG